MGPLLLRPGLRNRDFPLLLAKQNLHLRFYHLLADYSFFSGFLLLTFCCGKVLSWRIEFLSEIFSNKVRQIESLAEIENSTELNNCKRLSPLIIKSYHIYTLPASFDHEQSPNFPRTNSHFLYFRWKNQFVLNFTSTCRQFLRHDVLHSVLVITHIPIISTRRPFVSSRAGSRYYFSLSNRKWFPVLLLRFAGNWRWDDADVNNKYLILNFGSMKMLWLIPMRDYLSDAKTTFYRIGLILSLEIGIKIVISK